MWHKIACDWLNSQLVLVQPSVKERQKHSTGFDSHADHMRCDRGDPALIKWSLGFNSWLVMSQQGVVDQRKTGLSLLSHSVHPVPPMGS